MRTYHKAICFLSFLFLFKTGYAINEDSLRVEELGAKSLRFVYTNPDSARLSISEGIEICYELEDDHMWSLIYNYQGIYYDVSGQYDSAMQSYRKAIVHGKKGNVPTNTAGAINNIGLLFWNNHEYDSAIAYYHLALDIYEEIDSKKGQSNVLSNIGLIYTNQLLADKAVEAFRKVLHIKVELDDSLGIGKTLANIGGALEKKEQYDSSIHYKNLAEPFLIASGNEYELATLYHDFAVTLNIQDKKQEAIPYAEESLEIRRKLGSKKYIASTLNLLGGLYHSTRQYKKGHTVLDEAILIYEKYNIYRLLKGCYHRKAMIYRDQGMYQEAIPFFEKNIEAYEQVYDEDRMEKLLKVEEQYENEKVKTEILLREKELLEEEQKNTKMSIGLVFLGLLSLGVYLFFHRRIKRNREKKKQELLEQKLEISRELHDNIGSQLTYLSNGIDRAMKNNDSSKLEDISSFSRSTIKDLRTAVWGLNKELTVSDLTSKIKDETVKMKAGSDGMEIVVINDESDLVLNSMVAINVLRIVQEALQNATKHSNASNINVSLRLKNTTLMVQIKDNGKGFEMKEYGGFGLKSMQQRADKIGGIIEIKSEINQGTSVFLEVNTANDV